MAATIIICLIIAALMVTGVFSMRRRIVSGCCGATSSPARKIRVSDRDLRHYPYLTTLTIGGMHCRSCAVRVENALNSLDGVFATVNLHGGSAAVRMKREIPEPELRRAVTDAGYTVDLVRVSQPAPL